VWSVSAGESATVVGSTGLLLVVATDSCANTRSENIKNFEQPVQYSSSEGVQFENTVRMGDSNSVIRHEILRMRIFRIPSRDDFVCEL
jgi:hypothetical protein